MKKLFVSTSKNNYYFLSVSFLITELFIFVCLINSCKKEKVITLPTVKTIVVTNVTATSAAVSGEIISDGGGSLSAQGVVWNTFTNPTIELISKTSGELSSKKIESNITGLTNTTKYYVRAYATNASGTAYGTELTFFTGANIPILTTIDVTDIFGTSAISGGLITNDGGTSITTRGVVWSTSSGPTILLPTKTSDPPGNNSFTSKITGLTPNTKYYLRAYAINSAGTAYGNEKSFDTREMIIINHLLNTSLGSDIIQTKDVGYLTAREDIVKFDSMGNMLWAKEIINYPDFDRTKIIYTKDQNYLISNYIGLQKFDKDGNVLWTDIRSTLSGIVVGSSVESADGQYLSVGYSRNTGFVLQKISQNGVLEWTKPFSNLSVYSANIINTNDENFLVIGNDNPDQLQISKIDSIGNVIWQKSYTYSKEIVSTGVDRCSDNSFVIGITLVSSSMSYSILILKVDELGNKIWEKSISLGSGSIFRKITSLSDGGCAFVGGYYIEPYDPQYAFIVKLDQDGNKVLELSFSPQNSMDFVWTLNSVKETKDKNLVMVGDKTYIYSGTERGGWFLKIHTR